MLLPYYNKELIEAGCDEAGRGCLAGPVFAAAVILDKNFNDDLLRDSKKLKEKDRYNLRDMIINKSIAWAVEMADNNEIDKINILWASILSMHKAIEKLTIEPQYLIIDGNRFKPYKDIPHTCIIKGDDKYFSIAAASVLAKTYRDDFMNELHNKYPQYGWNKNKGYPTLDHRNAIKEYGITDFHRKSFKLEEKQLSLF
ncbi:MAG: ribonuclease HII [Bacteroidota bacterium]|nr:ribonuclease HII [Bacteroidota bacterium]